MKVGDYIRTKDYLGTQLICKIEKIFDEYCIDTDKEYWDTEHIIKSSPNIIDLIEVGDYVNGQLVTSAEEVVKNDDRYIGFGNYDYYLSKNEEIKLIVTKEQFEAIQYKIGGNK